MTQPAKTSICLWFEKGGLEAARFYVSLVPGSTLETEPQDPEPFLVAFSLAGTPYRIMNAGPMFRLSEAASIMVMTEDQAETDRLWSALVADGGAEGRCGWLKDRWGVSWQIVPRALGRYLGAPDREAAGRAQGAMMTMRKIDIAALARAFDGN